MLGAALWGQVSPQTPVAQSAPAPDSVVFEAGGRKMTRSEFDAMMKNLPENLRKQLGGDSPEARRRLAEQLGEIMSYASEARRLNLAEQPAAKVQIFFQQESTLATFLYQHLAETAKPAEAQERAWYDAHKSEFESATARHILIRFQGSRVPLKPQQKDLTEAEALAKAQVLRERIVKGEDFAAVAKAESDDTGSGQNGGDLGAFGRGRMVPAFDAAVFSLPVGEISQPVKSQYGYHLIQVQKRSVEPFEKLQPEIEKRLTGEAAQKAMDELKSKNPVRLDESYFGKPVPPVEQAKPAAEPKKQP